MSETEDAIIQDLLAEQKKLREQNDELLKKQKSFRSQWFSKEMLAIYTTVLAGVGAFWNQAADAIIHRHGIEEKQEVSEKVDKAVFQYVDGQVEGVYEVCGMYFEAVLEGMPAYQKRKTERILEELEGEDLEGEEDDGEDVALAPPVPRPSRPRVGHAAGYGQAETPAPPEPDLDGDGLEEVTEAGEASSVEKVSAPVEVYQQVLQAVQEGDLEKFIEDKKNKLRRPFKKK